MKPSIARGLIALLVSCGSFANASEAPRCQYVKVAALPIQYTDPSLQITTEGVINGTPARMLVDTGAYDTFLTRTGTERRGMSLENTGKTAFGAGGGSWIYETRVTEFGAGPARSRKRGYMRVLTEFGFTPSFDAILGSPFLLQTDLEISLAAKELRFFRPQNCKDTHLGYWDDKVLSVPFEPHNELGRNPHFFVSVNGQKMLAMIDTGAQASSITLAAAKRAGLKLDAPGVTVGEKVVGAGSRKVDRWLAVLDRFQIGDETIEHADLGVDDREGSTDVILGADFLRAHRVLFAMSQRKLYFSYIGGEPFGQRRKLEPWMQAEADAGNADAQMALSLMYAEGKRVARDEAAAEGWLEKAAANGSPQAQILSARKQMQRGDFAAALPRLRAGLDKLPANRRGALWLYLARVRNGEQALAQTELSEAFKRGERNEWPAPIAAFYLGKLSADELLREAADDRARSQVRTCQALEAMGEWHRAHGNETPAAALTARAEAECGAGTGAAKDRLVSSNGA